MLQDLHRHREPVPQAEPQEQASAPSAGNGGREGTPAVGEGGQEAQKGGETRLHMGAQDIEAGWRQAESDLRLVPGQTHTGRGDGRQTPGEVQAEEDSAAGWPRRVQWIQHKVRRQQYRRVWIYIGQGQDNLHVY